MYELFPEDDCEHVSEVRYHTLAPQQPKNSDPLICSKNNEPGILNCQN